MANIEQPTPRNTRAMWMRGLVMLLIIVLMGTAQVVINLLAVVQFAWLMFYGERNVALSDFGSSLGKWLAQSAMFLSYATNDKPFPWQPWPPANP